MVPEGRGVFTRMTITENLQMGAHIRKDKAGIAATWSACSAPSRA
jgi:branched-chain amino acid transport system ATP-binding protein